MAGGDNTAWNLEALLDAHGSAMEGMVFFRSLAELRESGAGGESVELAPSTPYWLACRRAWRALSLSGMVVVEGVPFLYFDPSRWGTDPVSWESWETSHDLSGRLFTLAHLLVPV